MTTITQPSAHTAATGHAPAVTWYHGSATAAPQAVPGTAMPLMGPPSHGATAQLMGLADSPAAIVLTGPPDPRGPSLLGPADPGAAIPLMGSAGRVAAGVPADEEKEARS